MKADDCFCHYLPAIIIGLPVLIFLIWFSVRRIKSWRKKRREAEKKRFSEEEKRIHKSTYAGYRSGFPTSIDEAIKKVKWWKK